MSPGSIRSKSAPRQTASANGQSLAKGLGFRAVVEMAFGEGVIQLKGWIESAAGDSELEEVYKTERRLYWSLEPARLRVSR